MQEKDQIKEAFDKVKIDISNLSSWIQYISGEIEKIKRTLEELKMQTQELKNSTFQHIIPTHRTPDKAFKPQYLGVSTGNEGVPTDRQTNQQTDRHIQKFAQGRDKISKIDGVSQILDSLDTLKKDLRTKFKKLTPQELNIFSIIYQLEEQGLIVDYPLLAEKTGLSQSSIRDYILKLIKKGIPLDKKKENNKQVALSIPLEFKKLASLDAILSLREL